MLKDFIGSFIVLACSLPIGIDIPGLQGPECRYALTTIFFLTALYGTGLVLTGDEEEGRGAVRRGQMPQGGEPLVETMTATKRYVEQQVKRESRQPKKARVA
ncbi:hypothetical protein [Geomonas subterranea]|uniref:hypothetical protein n=1 Tax=Geomonas subterranea TaxID=2847989 RepID=UPI001CD39BC8|nr:hypothetical protein [Geomonas fuzhouensis]